MKLTFLLSSLTVTAAAVVGATRELSESAIAGFTPKTSVTDHNAIDLDQALIEELVASEATFPDAKKIYEQGAHSKSFARITFDEGTSLPSDLPAKTKVTGVASDGTTVLGALYKDYKQGDVVIEVQYEVLNIQEKYVNCQVGGREMSGNLDGCFAEAGTLQIDGIGQTFPYTYVPHLDNDNGRTIQGFSTGADSRMRVNGNGNYYVDFQKFFNYYGRYDYADEWIQAAFSGTRTDFTNGNADFNAKSTAAKAQGIKKGTNYMSVAMYVIRELEDAIDDCNRGCDTADCNDDAVHALDEAVAFYTGSLEGSAPGGSGGSGKLLYTLAQKRCKQFNTCNSQNGIAMVNEEIFLEFERMKNNLVAAEPQCDAARANKERITQLLFVPMIQGTLRYAYILGKGPEPDGDDDNAEGAVFAASVLPMVHACDTDAATTVYNNMRVGASRPSWDDVKSAFESTYKCMGITCADVGGYWNDAEQEYWTDAKPCGNVRKSSKNGTSGSGLSTGGIIGIIIACVVVVAGGLYCFCRSKSQNQVEFKSDSNGTPQV